MRDVSGGYDDLKQRLSEALMEIDSLEARAAALAAICQIEQQAARPKG
jgi:hypothetical protein